MLIAWARTPQWWVELALHTAWSNASYNVPRAVHCPMPRHCAPPPLPAPLSRYPLSRSVPFHLGGGRARFRLRPPSAKLSLNMRIRFLFELTRRYVYQKKENRNSESNPLGYSSWPWAAGFGPRTKNKFRASMRASRQTKFTRNGYRLLTHITHSSPNTHTALAACYNMGRSFERCMAYPRPTICG